MRKLNLNKIQILHITRVRKHNPEKPPETVIGKPNGRLTTCMEAEFGGHLFDFPTVCTDPNASDFEESHNVIVPRSHCHDSNVGQNWENYPVSDPSAVHPSNVKPHGQNRDVGTATDLRHNDSSTQAYDSNMDIGSDYEPTQHSLTRQSDPFRQMKLAILLVTIFRKTDLVIPEAVNISFTLTLILITQRCTDIEVCKNLF